MKHFLRNMWLAMAGTLVLSGCITDENDGDVCAAFGIIYGAILDTVPEDPEGNVLKAFFTGKLF